MDAGIYPRIVFPDAPDDRPFVFVNMVATIDGKIITGGRGEPVQDLGSSVDHRTMHQLEGYADGIMIGAGTLRATPRINLPPPAARFCVSKTGNVDRSHNFFSDNDLNAWLVTVEQSAADGKVIKAGLENVDMRMALAAIRQLGVTRLLCEGGSELNAALLGDDLVDELFLTVAPKIRLGRDIPTIADGLALKREDVLNFSLVSSFVVENEVFLRYRRHL